MIAERHSSSVVPAGCICKQAACMAAQRCDKCTHLSDYMQISAGICRANLLWINMLAIELLRLLCISNATINTALIYADRQATQHLSHTNISYFCRHYKRVFWTYRRFNAKVYYSENDAIKRLKRRLCVLYSGVDLSRCGCCEDTAFIVRSQIEYLSGASVFCSVFHSL